MEYYKLFRSANIWCILKAITSHTIFRKSKSQIGCWLGPDSVFPIRGLVEEAPPSPRNCRLSAIMSGNTFCEIFRSIQSKLPEFLKINYELYFILKFSQKVGLLSDQFFPESQYYFYWNSRRKWISFLWNFSQQDVALSAKFVAERGYTFCWILWESEYYVPLISRRK